MEEGEGDGGVIRGKETRFNLWCNAVLELREGFDAVGRGRGK